MDAKWTGPSDKIWKDSQCKHLKNLKGQFPYCRQVCEDMQGCNAINVKLGEGCALRNCPYPTPIPEWDFPGHVGYAKEGKK